MPPAGSSVSFGVSEGSPQPDRNDRKSHWITESRVTLGGNILKAGALWKKIGLGKHAAATKLRTPLPQEPQHRFLPAQAGSFKDRRDANSLDALESVSVEAVIEAVNEAKGGNRKGKAKATGRVCSCTRPRAALARRRGCVARSVPGGDFRGRTRGL